MILQSEGKLSEAEHLQRLSLSLFQEMSDRSNAARVAGDLSSTLVLEGQLAEARKLLPAAIAEARENQVESYLPFILIYAGDLSAVEDSASDARRNYAESLAIQEKNGESGASVSRMSLAQLSLDSGDAESALNAARAVKADTAEAQVSVSAIIAQALMVQRKIREAAQEIEAVQELASTSQNRISAGKFIRAQSRVIAADGHYEDALKLLKTNLLESQRMGCVLCQFETRFAIAELELNVGRTAAARTHATALQGEARQKGFLAIAKRCSGLLSSSG